MFFLKAISGRFKSSLLVSPLVDAAPAPDLCAESLHLDSHCSAHHPMEDFWIIMIIPTSSVINQPNIFGSIVVSISACHSKEQLAGGRGSIPRQRVSFLFAIPVFCCNPLLE
jgi:hypothetical protein